MTHVYVYTYRTCVYISATVPSGRWACNNLVSEPYILLDWNPLRGPSIPVPQRPNSVAWTFSPPCAHLAPHVGHLARLVGHLGANMSHKCSQDARKMPSWSQHRQTNASATFSSTPKIPKNLSFPRVCVGFLPSSPCAKILPKCSQHAPKTSQIERKIANLALSWPILVATSCQLGPNFAHFAPIFAPTCAEIPRKSRPGRQEPLQDFPRRLQVPVLWIFLASGASFFMVSDPSKP